ncbi:MAG: GspH/FimT family protein [Candidatus Omnitrophica bacterium]|nr:GspH/FimT family protein [Candidatus Omnitrophota bacterium]MCM8776853.1 GspH/FimT family protein [Candidatus Omnitrophota bacterium]
MRWVKYGFSVIEVLISLLILSLLMVPTTAYFLKYHRGVVLERAANEIIDIANLAREYAVNERKEFYVIFNERKFVVLRENRQPVDKEYHLPEHIIIKDRSAGFSPLVFNPDGTAKTGGYLIVRDIAGGKEIKIVLHNLTGRCFIEK